MLPQKNGKGVYFLLKLLFIFWVLRYNADRVSECENFARKRSENKMEYAMIIAAAVAIAGQFSWNKVYEKRIVRDTSHLFVFPVIVAAVSVFLFLVLNLFALRITAYGVSMAACSAVISVVSAILGILIVRIGRVSVYTTFMMLGGMLLPYLYGIIFLKEELSAFRMVGLGILIFILVFSVWGKAEQKKHDDRVIFYILCILVFFLNGSLGIVSKVHQISPQALPTCDFLIWNYFFQFILSSVLFILYRCIFAKRVEKNVKEEGIRQGEKPASKLKSYLLAFLIATMYALFSGGGFLLQLLAAIKLPASMQYPFVTGGSIVLTTLAAALFFKEKITIKGWFILLLTLSGTVLFVF